ncbi:MAG: DMT family transporter [Gammaproteobacteria bacterium]|nr:DMT family transporter [Gammaproteobacteria bacterium]
MSVVIAYLIVVLIWSTTPLGIVWSSESVSPTLAVLSRMVIGVIIGCTILAITKTKLPRNRQALRLYAYSGGGIFTGMLFAYQASSHIASGMMSLIFGLAPIISGLLGQKILNEAKFSKIKKIALVLSLLGLAFVCSDSLSLSGDNAIGLLLVMVSVCCFSFSAVMVKSIDICINPMATTLGALLFATPLFLLSWLLSDGTLPIQDWQPRSLWAILYLGIFGSLIGFIAYYYVLQKLTASTVSLITLITPIFALTLGAYLNNETISVNLVMGAVLVLAGLTSFIWGDKFVKRMQLNN